MSKRAYSRYLIGALVAGALPLSAGAAFAQDARGPGMGPRGGSPMFTQMDADKDGKVTSAEVEAFHKARAAEIDANKDGKITAAEMKTYMDKQREKHMADRLARLDKDGDGAVSVKEFEDGAMWRAARMDHNGDGVIDDKDRRGMGARGHGGSGGHRHH